MRNTIIQLVFQKYWIQFRCVETSKAYSTWTYLPISVVDEFEFETSSDKDTAGVLTLIRTRTLSPWICRLSKSFGQQRQDNAEPCAYYGFNETWSSVYIHAVICRYSASALYFPVVRPSRKGVHRCWETWNQLEAPSSSSSPLFFRLSVQSLFG